MREKVTSNTYWEEFHLCSLVDPHHSSADREGNFWCKKEEVDYFFFTLSFLCRIYCVAVSEQTALGNNTAQRQLHSALTSFTYTQNKGLHFKTFLLWASKLSVDFSNNLFLHHHFTKQNTSENSGPTPSESWVLLEMILMTEYLGHIQQSQSPKTA